MKTKLKTINVDDNPSDTHMNCYFLTLTKNQPVANVIASNLPAQVDCYFCMLGNNVPATTQHSCWCLHRLIVIFASWGKIKTKIKNNLQHSAKFWSERICTG